MKKYLIITLVNLLINTLIFSQSSDGFKYQAIIRDATGNVNANASISMEISILQGSADGITVFTEIHNITSNTFGLVNLTIGSQNPSNFALIDWANGPYFIKIIIDGFEFGTSQLLSVPYALHAKTSETAITTENYTEADPLFSASPIANITQTQIDNWTNKLESYSESDPLFDASVASKITQADLDAWTNKLDSFLETDPEFAASIAKGLTANDTAYWNSKLDNFVEHDPTFIAHPSAGITADDIVRWKALWFWYTTNAGGYQKIADDGDVSSTNELQTLTISNDTLFLENGGFVKILSSGITGTDTANWNNKNYSSLTNAPDLANSTNQKTIALNTDDNTSSLNITKNNGTSVFKVDGSGAMTGDGSGLSNVRPKIAYAQGNLSVYFHEGMIPGLNLYEAQIMREVTINCPGPGIIFAHASGYCDWESKEEDLVRIWFWPHPTVSPTSSWETPDFHNLRIVSDYQCADSSDQYTSWSISKIYTINSAQNFTVYVCADKPFTESKFLIGDVVLSLMFFPTGGTDGGMLLKTNETNKIDPLPKVAPGSIDGNSPVSNDFPPPNKDSEKSLIIQMEQRIKTLEERLEKIIKEK
ncbi:MAG: hypothetical protein KKG99_04975 [Bacteroidetes bacterium]|nr:hypothetical protein [Bacteroidota bacterium]